jgi:hypothetical protein
MLITLNDRIPRYYPSPIFPPRWLDLRADYARDLHQLQRADHLRAIVDAIQWDAVERLRITLLVLMRVVSSPICTAPAPSSLR